MANRYAVATGNWSSPSVWSTTSGGSGGASIPAPGDSVFFNAASGNITVTVDSGTIITNFSSVGFTGTINNTGSYTMELRGTTSTVALGTSNIGHMNLSINSNTVSLSSLGGKFGSIYFYGSIINTTSDISCQNIYFSPDYSKKNLTLNLGGNLSSEGSITFNSAVYNQTINFNGYTVVAINIKDNNSSGSKVVLNMQNSVLIISNTLTSSVPPNLAFSSSRMVINQDNNSNIIIQPKTPYDVALSLGNKTYKNLTIIYDYSSLKVIIKNSPTINNFYAINKSGYNYICVDEDTAITVNKLTLNGGTNGLMVTYPSGVSTPTGYFSVVKDGQVYGKNLTIDEVNITGVGLKAYAGADSEVLNSNGWLVQDPPKANTLIDVFDSGNKPNASLWSYYESGTGSVYLSSGKLVMEWLSGSNSFVSITSKDTYDFVDSVLYINVASKSGDGLNANIYYLNNNLFMSMNINNTSTPIYYRFRGVSSGENVTIYAEYGSILGWTIYDTKTVSKDFARSLRFEINGSRNNSPMYLAIEDIGVTPEPAASFTSNRTSGDNPLIVEFSDTSNFGPTSWSWTFGDGTTSTSQNPTHTYALPGTYTVKLTASKTGTSKTVTKTNYINVTPKIVTGLVNGSLILSGSVAGMATAYGAVSGSIMLTGSVRGVVIQDASRIEKKTYIYKVYDPNGNYLETWRDVNDEPQFTEEINSLGSSMTIEIPRNSDSVGQVVAPLQTESGQSISTEDGSTIYAATETRNQIGPGTSVDYNNRIDIYVYYGYTEPLLTEEGAIIYTESGDPLLVAMGAPNGRRIFTGFVSGINSRYGDTETTVLQLSSFGWDLGQFPIMQGSNTTVSYLSKDPSFIAQDLTDKFATQSASYGSYTHREEGSIATTGTTVSYTFRANTYAEGLSKTLELMPSNWYYRVDLGSNIVYYRERSATPHHYFLLGKHIKSLELAGSILDSVNDVLFTGGGDPALYIRRTEIPGGRTRRRLNNLSDNRVTVLESAEIIAENSIGDANKVLYRTTVEILSEQYDIESIEIGQMVGFRNFDNYVDGLTMQIVGRSYTPDAVTLQLESMPLSINKRIEDIRRNLAVQENQNAPNSPS